MNKILPLFLLFLTISLPSYGWADKAENMEKMADQLKEVSKNISRGKFDGGDLSEWTKLTIKMKSDSSLCVSNNEAALLELKTVIDGLGEKVKGEDSEVTKKRSAYKKEQDGLNKALAKCNLFVTDDW